MAEYRIQVVIDPRTKPGARVVERDLRRVQQRADATKASLTRMLGILGGSAVLFKAVRTIAQFEQVMSTVAGVTNATSKEMELLTKRAKELGISTRFTATQAGEGLVELARAGLSVTDSLDAVGSSLVLAQAGTLGLAEAADLTTTAIKVFKLEATDAAEVADVLVIAANSSKTNVSEMGQAFTFAAANANDLELSVQETAAALAVLAEGGLKATRGGTAFRSILLGLAAPTEQAKEVLLGISDNLADFDIKARGIVPVLELLASAELDVEQKTAIFGKRFGAAASIMFSNIPKFKEVIQKFEDMGGEAQRVADVMDDNLNGAILKTKSAFEGLLLEIGSGGASGAFRSLFDTITNGLRSLAANADRVIDTFEFLIILLGVRFAKFAIGAVINQLRLLAVALVTNPIGVFVTTVGLAIAALVAFGDELVISAESGATFGEFMQAAGETARMAFQGLADFLNETLAPAFAAIGTGSDTGIKAMLETVAFGLDAIAGFFRSTFEQIKQTASLKGVGDTLLFGVTEGINIFLTLVEKALDNFRATFVGTFRALGAAASALASILLLKADAAFQTAKGYADFSVEQSDRTAEAVAKAEQASRDLDIGSNFAREINKARREFEKVDTITLIDNADLREAATKIGTTRAKIETEAYKVQAETGLTSVLQGIFDRMDTLAQERLAAAAAAAAEAKAAAEASSGPSPEEKAAGLKTETAGLDKRNDALEEYLKDLEREMELLGLSSSERQIANELIAAENDLREQGVELTALQRDALQVELERLQTLQLQADVLEEIRGPQEDLVNRQAALNQLMQDGKITTDEYNKALRDLAKQSASTAGTMGSTIQPGLETVAQQLYGIGQFTEQTLTRVFKGAEDALVEFVTTGEVNFSKLVDSMLKDIARLLVQQGLQLLLGMLSGGGGGIGGLISGIAGGALGGGGGGGQPSYVGGGSYSGGGGSIPAPSIGGGGCGPAG